MGPQALGSGGRSSPRRVSAPACGREARCGGQLGGERDRSVEEALGRVQLAHEPEAMGLLAAQETLRAEHEAPRRSGRSRRASVRRQPTRRSRTAARARRSAPAASRRRHPRQRPSRTRAERPAVDRGDDRSGRRLDRRRQARLGHVPRRRLEIDNSSSPRSPPAQKVSPLPTITTAATSWTSASFRVLIAATSSALRRCGRSIVATSTWPRSASTTPLTARLTPVSAPAA